MSQLQTLKHAVRRDGSAEQDDAVRDVVAEIISAVAAGGDEAVRRYSERLDGWNPESFRLSAEEVAA